MSGSFPCRGQRWRANRPFGAVGLLVPTDTGTGLTPGLVAKLVAAPDCDSGFYWEFESPLAP